MYIIAGLGNPGIKYEKTRHNMGFRVIDVLADRLGIDVSKNEFKALTGKGMAGGEKVLLVKPQTFMNLSGQSLQQVMHFYKEDHDHLMVIYDDLDIPLGSIRLRKSGGPGTHNGMRSVVQELGYRDFPRLRIGIGSPDKDMVDFVIGKVPKEEQELLQEAAKLGAAAVEDYITLGIDLAMNRNNTRKEKTSAE